MLLFLLLLLDDAIKEGKGGQKWSRRVESEIHSLCPQSLNPLPCKRSLSLISYQRARAILAMPRDESLKVIRSSSQNTPLCKLVSRQR